MCAYQPSPGKTVTTVIPTYKRPGLLARSIASAVHQSFADVHICVYDNASGDETADTVRALGQNDPRISYFCHETNIGALRNFEFGLRSVATPYFSLLSDDDILLPNFYKRALEEFSRYPDALFVVGGTLEQLVHGDVLTPGRTTDLQPGYYDAPRGLGVFITNGVPLWTGILFRREVIDVVGGFDLNSSNADEDFLLRCAAVCGFSLFHEPVAVFCHSEGSISRSYDIETERRHHSVLATKVAEFARVLGSDGESLISAWSRSIHRTVARASLRDIAHGQRNRLASRLETMVKYPSPGPRAAAVRLLLAFTSTKPAFFVARLLARGVRRTRYEMLRARNRALTSRYRPVIRALEGESAGDSRFH